MNALFLSLAAMTENSPDLNLPDCKIIVQRSRQTLFKWLLNGMCINKFKAFQLQSDSDWLASPNNDVTVVPIGCRISGGELFERIVDEDFELTEREVIKYMLQIIDGVQFIHKQGIVHLDLKPENIMCINKTGSKIKLIDFGLARRLGKQT